MTETPSDPEKFPVIGNICGVVTIHFWLCVYAIASTAPEDGHGAEAIVPNNFCGAVLPFHRVILQILPAPIALGPLNTTHTRFSM